MGDVIKKTRRYSILQRVPDNHTNTTSLRRKVQYKFPIGLEVKYIGMDIILSGRTGTVLDRRNNNAISNKTEKSYRVKFELRTCWISEYELEEVINE